MNSISKHYERQHLDTPGNYVMDVDGYAFWCPNFHGLVVAYHPETKPLSACRVCGCDLVPFEATNANSIYPDHWIKEGDVRRAWHRMVEGSQ